MLQQTVDGLDIRPGGTYVDLTFGGGGHSREILRRLGDDGRLFGFDQDLDAMKGALQDPRFIFVRSNFRFLKNWMRYYEVERVDGILADLGVSSHHLDDAARGFSFRQDAPLDMRMNQKAKCSARTVLRDYTEEQLASVLYLYGELKNSRRLASAIVKARAQGEIMTTGQLAALLQPLLPRDREKKDLARVFQALRIEVNGEMDALRQMLHAAVDVLGEGGRLSVLTYHSLEDRMVKNVMKSGNEEGKLETDVFGRSHAPMKPLSNKPQIPTEQEQAENPMKMGAVQGQYGQFNSVATIIGTLQYNTAVYEYQKEVGGFPASVLGALSGVKEVEPFARDDDKIYNNGRRHRTSGHTDPGLPITGAPASGAALGPGAAHAFDAAR